METETNKIDTLALELINDQTTMTLATSDNEGPWAAPVYYCYLKNVFYFFSDSKSRHIRESISIGSLAAAIFAQASTWQGIRGIQMSGKIKQVRPGLKAVEVIRAYLKKYPFTKEFFKPGIKPDLETFTSNFKVRLYRFTPTYMLYIDNGIKFGFKQEVTL